MLRLFRLSGVFLLLLFTATAFAETPQSDPGFNPAYKSDLTAMPATDKVIQRVNGELSTGTDQTINCHACKAKNSLNTDNAKNVDLGGVYFHASRSEFSLYYGNLMTNLPEQNSLFLCLFYPDTHNPKPT